MKVVLLKEFGGVENFEDADWPEREPAPEEVKIRARAVSVNPTDFKARRGGNQGAVPPHPGPGYRGRGRFGGRERDGVLPR